MKKVKKNKKKENWIMKKKKPEKKKKKGKKKTEKQRRKLPNEPCYQKYKSEANARARIYTNVKSITSK